MKILCQSFRTSFFLSFFLSVFLYFQVYVFLSLSPSLGVLPIFSRIPSGLDPLRCRVVIILIISYLDPRYKHSLCDESYLFTLPRNGVHFSRR